MYSDRNAILESDEFTAQVRIAVCDWCNYWAVNGTESIQDETLRELTDGFINVFLYDPERYTRKLTHLAISEPSVKDAVEVTDTNVSTAITNILSHALKYII